MPEQREIVLSIDNTLRAAALRARRCSFLVLTDTVDQLDERTIADLHDAQVVPVTTTYVDGSLCGSTLYMSAGVSPNMTYTGFRLPTQNIADGTLRVSVSNLVSVQLPKESLLYKFGSLWFPVVHPYILFAIRYTELTWEDRVLQRGEHETG